MVDSTRNLIHARTWRVWLGSMDGFVHVEGGFANCCVMGKWVCWVVDQAREWNARRMSLRVCSLVVFY